MVLVVDVETIDKQYQGICDIAWATIERNKVKAVKNYLPAEHISKMLTGCFSAPKAEETLAEVEKGNAIIAQYDAIMNDFLTDVAQATRIYAYNASFDRDKITKTSKMLDGTFTEILESAGYIEKWRDLWAWASNTILYKKSFIDFCEVHGLTTPKGFYSTTAETCLKYLKGDINYVERHCARADVIDEVEIYKAIKAQTKSESKEICPEKENFQGSPFYNVKRLKDAINS